MVSQFLEVFDELNHLRIEFTSFREQLDTGGPLGRAAVVIVSAIAELDRNPIVKRVRAGTRKAKLGGEESADRCCESMARPRRGTASAA